MANTYLTRTPSSTGNRRKFTFSFWIKKCANGTSETIYNVRPSASGANRISFHSSDTFRIALEPINKYLFTNRKFTDNFAWYHIVVAVDTEQGTAADRVKLYVNGVQETSFGTATYPDQNTDLDINTQNVINIGRDLETSSNYFNGVLSHFNFIDGTAYDATAFGSTDATTGEWKINTSPSVTYGTNGFFILKDGNSVTDQSGNSNNWTVASGTLTKTEDCPSNVFATLNPLVRHTGTVANGNTRYGTSSSSWIGIPATLGNLTGKWYWEYKLTTGAEWSQCGIVSQAGYNGILTSYVGGITNGVAMNTGGGDIYTAGGSAQAWFGSARSVGQIISVALDCDNNKIYWGTNGVWGNSSNPATGSNGYSIPSALNTDKPYFPAFSVHNCTIDINFGNGYFGSTQISSAGTNASGIGIFEYDVPTGYSALSTKGLNL